MVPLRALVFVGLFLPSLLAQYFTDNFLYPASTLIPGYTEQRGNWTSTGQSVQSQLGVTFQELTFDGLQDQDGAAEVTVIYDATNAGLQYAGPLVRYSGSGSTATFFMLKLQDNGVPYVGFDYYYVYFYNGASFTPLGLTAPISVSTTAARARLQVTDVNGQVRVQFYIDTDLDGLWNITGETTTALGFGTAGKCGIANYQSALADDLKYFDISLFGQGIPSLGTTFTMKGSGLPNYPYIAAASAGHGGFPGLSSLRVPIDFDSFFVFSQTTPSLFSGFFGTTGPDGSLTLTLNIPNLPSLSGASIWVAVITHNGLVETGVSPDTQVTFL